MTISLSSKRQCTPHDNDVRAGRVSTDNPLAIISSLALDEPREAVGAPFFAAHAVMHEEETTRVVLPLDAQQPRIVRSPIRFLPIALEEAALRHIRAGIRRDIA